MPTYPEYVYQTLARARDIGQRYCDKQLANLFTQTIPNKKDMPATSIVDWSFLYKDDGQPGEPADWVKKRIRVYEKRKNEFHTEMLEDLKRMYK